MAPAMAAGVTSSLSDIGMIVKGIEGYEPKPARPYHNARQAGGGFP